MWSEQLEIERHYLPVVGMMIRLYTNEICTKKTLRQMLI